MHINSAGASLGKGFKMAFGFFDHQMHVQRQFGHPAAGFDNKWPHGDIGNEMPIHYIDVQPVCASGINVHVETCPQLQATLQQIKSLGCEAGVALNPDTPVEAIEAVMPQADLILVMSVYPGFSGQGFIPGSVMRVAEIRKKLDALSSPAWIEVDGGVTVENVRKLKDAGTTAFVAATAVFKHPQGAVAGIRTLRDALTLSSPSGRGVGLGK